MKKIIISGLLSVVVATCLSASTNIPLSAHLVSTENGGTGDKETVLSDGIGIFSVEKPLAILKKQEKLPVAGDSCDDKNIETMFDIYIDNNGTCKGTIVRSENKCYGDTIGSEFIHDGDFYLVVDDNTIRDHLDRAETLCVSNVTDMNSMFLNATNFNQDLSGWDVSNVTDMSNMFRYATNFNQDLSGWDVSNVTNMSYMFVVATNFNQDLSGWDVSNVTNMSYMIYYATNFNQDLSGWDVSNVTNMTSMFNGATNFNQDLSGWDVSNVTDMSYMFRDATNFNQDLSGWDVSNVTTMNSMFYNATNFNQDLSGWDVSNVIHYVGFSVSSALSPQHLPNFK